VFSLGDRKARGWACLRGRVPVHLHPVRAFSRRIVKAVVNERRGLPPHLRARQVHDPGLPEPFEGCGPACLPHGHRLPSPARRIAVTVEAAEALFEPVFPSRSALACAQPGRQAQLGTRWSRPADRARRRRHESVQVESDHIARSIRGDHRRPVVVAGALVGGRQPPGLLVLRARHKAQGAVAGVDGGRSTRRTSPRVPHGHRLPDPIRSYSQPPDHGEWMRGSGFSAADLVRRDRRERPNEG